MPSVLRRRKARHKPPYARTTQLAESHPDLDPGFHEPYGRCAPFTMTSVERMYALWQAVRHVRRAAIMGDYVECGVWRGGSSMLAALTLAEEGDTSTRLWLYDTFEGMSKPTERDRAFDSDTSVAEHWDRIASDGGAILARASLAEVRANMTATGIDPRRIVYVVGKVEETLPREVPDRISLLRLDTDWYESTRHELEHLYPRLSPGGVLIIDDYGHWAGAREAVDEFFAGVPQAPLLSRIDYTGRLAVKR